MYPFYLHDTRRYNSMSLYEYPFILRAMFLLSRICQSKNGPFRPFRLKPKSGFRSQSKKSFFDTGFFDCLFRLADPVEKRHPVEKYLPVEKFSRKSLFEPIASLMPPQKHTYTPTHPQQVPHSIITQQDRRWLGCYQC